MIRGLLFDLNGTVIDILTNEEDDNVWRTLANFLSYQNIYLPPNVLRQLYGEINRRQRRDSVESYPEFDVVAVFREILHVYALEHRDDPPLRKHRDLALILAEIFRAAARFKLELYPDVIPILDELRTSYKLAAVSDGQSAWAGPEMRAAGLDGYFEPLIVSGDYGFRKPDERMFRLALSMMGMTADEVIYIGNDLYRDVLGGHRCGLKTVFFKSNQGDHRHRGAEPDYIIYHFQELPAAIHFLANR